MKTPIIFLFLLSSMLLKAQNEVGAFYFPQLTAITNLENSKSDLYTALPTVSSGVGINYIHFFNGKRDYKNLKPKKGIRIDLMYSAHNQKFKSEWQPLPTYDVWEHKGKKRLDYLKLSFCMEYFKPFTRKLSYIFYAGPQVSYLVKSDGGIVTWRDRDERGYLYYDLPPADNKYYKRFTLDAVVGVGIDYELTRYLNLSTSLRADYSLTTMDNPGAVINDYPQYNSEIGRGGSRNLTLALLIGVEYTLHSAEHAKTRY